MYFVQFQHPPCVLTEELPFLRTWIQTTVSIRTQPTNLTYNQDITLKASLVSSNDDDTPFLTKLYEWDAGTESLSIVFDVSIGVIWPVRILVCADEQDSGSLSPVANNIPRVCLAWSAPFDNLSPGVSHERVERRFTLSSTRILRIWEYYERNPVQMKYGGLRAVQNVMLIFDLRTSGVVLLSHLDDVIGLRTDGVKQLEQKFALATSRKLSVIDMSQNCGAIGIAVAQLIPDSSVVILDDAEAMPTIEENIRVMSAAFASDVKFGDWNATSDEEPGNTGRPVDMIFSTASPIHDEKSLRAVEVLRKMMERSPKAVVVVVEEEMMDKIDETEKAKRIAKPSPIAELLRERSHKLRGREVFGTVPQCHLMVFHGSNRR